jgi:hypothetical protein
MKTKINFLLKSGLSKNTLVKLNESKINLLYEKFKKKEKEETKEAITKTVYQPTKNPQDLAAVQDALKKVNPNATMEIEEVDDSLTQSSIASQGYDPDQDIPTEGFLREKFESKAQQGLFWARCNKCSSKNCKWCKMAKEFSDSTSKKQYKNMPEKKHPEKTVKYKKKKTNESLQKFIENTIIELLESKVDAKMTKKDLINSIKNSKKEKDESYILDKPKKMDMFSDEAPMELPIGRMFSIGKRK